MTPFVLERGRGAQNEVDAEVIDLRWLDRASIDWDTIEASLTKTNKVLIAEQGARGTSYGGWLADEIHRRFFDLLDAPVWRVTGGEASPSISKVLERAAIAEGRRSRRSPRRDREVLTMAHVLGCPASQPTRPRRFSPSGSSRSRRDFAAADAIATVETEKAAVDVEADAAGRVLKTLVPPGAQVEVGDPIAVLGDPGEVVDDIDALLVVPRRRASHEVTIPERRDVPSDPESAAPLAEEVEIRQRRFPGQRRTANGRVFASPLARKIAHDAGLGIDEITGSGPRGRILRRDVDAAIAARRSDPGARPVGSRVRDRRQRLGTENTSRRLELRGTPALSNPAGHGEASHREQAADAALLRARDRPGRDGCSRSAPRSTRMPRRDVSRQRPRREGRGRSARSGCRT